MFSIFLINSVLIAITMIVHYEALLQISRLMPRLKIKNRFRVAVGLMGVMIAHIIEVWIFGITYYLLLRTDVYGYIDGDLEHTLMNSIYFSFVTYTSLGFGDQVPVGLIRFTAGLEALTGLVLIAMTASFLYFQIEKYWSQLET